VRLNQGSLGSSARPMHRPQLWPPHGIPSIAGMTGLPGIVDSGDGEFGTRSGVHIVVYRSSDSPVGQAATVAVAPPDDSVMPHRNVQAVEQHERGGRLWLALI
jgi:hypothetical protein